MLRAILAGIKTETRRSVTPPPGADGIEVNYIKRGKFQNVTAYGVSRKWIVNPRYFRGDVVAIKETLRNDGNRWIYELDGEPVGDGEYNAPILKNLSKPVIPSLLMPDEAARYFIEIKSFTVEHLQDITAKAAIAEGASQFENNFGKFWTYDEGKTYKKTPVEAYAQLWERINNPAGLSDPDLPFFVPHSRKGLVRSVRGIRWMDNPFVWVFKFKRLDFYKPNLDHD